MPALLLFVTALLEYRIQLQNLAHTGNLFRLIHGHEVINEKG